jgi:hypothetical protein
MSKSVGNVVDPRTVMLGGKDQKKDPPYGADVLRLWVASVDYSSDVMIGGRILGQVTHRCAVRLCVYVPACVCCAARAGAPEACWKRPLLLGCNSGPSCCHV